MKSNEFLLLLVILLFLFTICNYHIKENFNINKLNIWTPPNIPTAMKYSSNEINDLNPKFGNNEGECDDVCFPKPGYQYDGIWKSNLKNENGKGYRNWSLGHRNMSKGTYCGKSPSFQYNKLYFPMKQTISPPDCPIKGIKTKLCCI